MESDIKRDLHAKLELNDYSEKRCTNIAGKIKKYLIIIAEAYNFNPEQKNAMLLTVIEL